MIWWDDTFDMAYFACVTMVGFAIVAGVGENAIYAVLLDSRSECFLKLVDVNAGASGADGTED